MDIVVDIILSIGIIGLPLLMYLFSLKYPGFTAAASVYFIILGYLGWGMWTSGEPKAVYIFIYAIFGLILTLGTRFWLDRKKPPANN
jgi:hypothetical protein